MNELSARTQDLKRKVIRNMHDASKELFERAPLYASHTAGLSDGTAAKTGFRFDIVPPGKRVAAIIFSTRRKRFLSSLGAAVRSV